MSDERTGLETTHARIEAACARCGRRPEEVTLVAVAKTHGPEAVRAAHAAGARDIGESYAQELRDKQRDLEDLADLRWHFVGAVQTNKVRYLVGKVVLVHAVDTFEAARALSDRAERMDVGPVPILLSVNVGDEESKRGVSPDETPAFYEEVLGLPGVEVRGLMCLPPWQDDPEDARRFFRRLRELRDALREGRPEGERLTELSMGMSHDLEVAVEEGATLVRVGTDIFGARPRRE